MSVQLRIGWLYGHVIGGHDILVYLAFLLLPVVHWVIYHSRFGLRLRACGENPHAADVGLLGAPSSTADPPRKERPEHKVGDTEEHHPPQDGRSCRRRAD